MRSPRMDPSGAWCLYEGELPVLCDDPMNDFFSGRAISLIVPQYTRSVEERIDSPIDQDAVGSRCLVVIASYKTLSPTTLQRRARYQGGRKARRAEKRLRGYQDAWSKINRHFAKVFGISIVTLEIIEAVS